jgi:hypothetical protein
MERDPLGLKSPEGFCLAYAAHKGPLFHVFIGPEGLPFRFRD